MKFLKYVVILVGAYFVLSSCVSFDKKNKESEIKVEDKKVEYNKKLDSLMIDEVTTCKHGSISKIKKNLILLGYEIESSNNKGLITKYKQGSSKINGEKFYDKIIVTKTGKDLIKFKKIEKYESYYIKESSPKVKTVWKNTKMDMPIPQRYCEKKFSEEVGEEVDTCVNKFSVYSDASSKSDNPNSLKPNTPTYPVYVPSTDVKVEQPRGSEYETTTQVHEYEPNYYVKHLDSYKEFQNKVCGIKPVKKLNTNVKK